MTLRIGIHTGHAVPAGGGYTGLAVHRAARICATARGGEVLVSQATQAIVEDEEEKDPGFTLMDLGEQQLKDLFTNCVAYGAFQSDSRDRPQISFYSWYQDYPAPWDFIGPLFTCAFFVPGNPGNANVAEFCNPRIDAQVRQALALQAQGLAAAAPRWATIDHELVDQAPWVPLYTPRDLTVLSARVGNYQFHPYWNLLIDQLWVR